MKYCVKCGAEMLDEAVICVKCGCTTEKYKEQMQNATKKDTNNLKNVAKIFMIISTVLIGLFLLLPLAWKIPMTISYCKKIDNNEQVSTSFKVCTLLFVSLIAGIIMLCDNE